MAIGRKRVELDIEEYRRLALLHNLAAIATDDRRDFYEGYVSHVTASRLQASERLLTWALFMPGEYKITVEHVRATEDGLSPYIEIESRFGQGGIEKIENSPIHHIVLKFAKELAGGEDLLEAKDATGKVLAASWLLASAILNAPDGKKPSEGLAILAEKGVLPRAALNRLKPIFEGLDALLGSVSRVDKAYLVGKLVDYDGYVEESRLLVSAEKIKKIPIELDGVEIRMADLAEAAAKAFSEEGGWFGNELYFGRAKEVPELESVPAFKAMAALKADELRRKELVKYVELRRYEIDGGEIKIMAAKAREELTPITRLEAIWREFKIGKYTHLRLVIGGEKYEFFYSGGRFAIRGEGARKLKKALEELGLNDVKMTSDGRLRFGYERLEALLNKGVEAYAVRKAKMSEAQWRMEITYGGVTMELKMTYDERNNRLEKFSRTGKIEAIVYKEGVTEGKRVKFDLDLLTAIGEGQLAVIKERCKNLDNCLEKQLAEALSVASKNFGFSWSVVGGREKTLYIYLPSDFKDVVRRLK